MIRFGIGLVSLTAGLLLATPASACHTVPPHAVTPLEDLLDRADGVYVLVLRSARIRNPDVSTWTNVSSATSLEDLLERARSSARQSVEYEFQVLNVIHGANVEAVHVELPFRYPAANHTDFDGHSDQAFWGDVQAGRASISSDCNVVADFRFGDVYVLVRSNGWHVKSFERVTSRDDQFYQFLIDRFHSN